MRKRAAALTLPTQQRRTWRVPRLAPCSAGGDYADRSARPTKVSSSVSGISALPGDCSPEDPPSAADLSPPCARFNLPPDIRKISGAWGGGLLHV